jgi:hypothetical protein
VQHIIPLLFGPELMGEVVTVGSNLIGAKSHVLPPVWNLRKLPSF